MDRENKLTHLQAHPGFALSKVVLVVPRALPGPVNVHTYVVPPQAACTQPWDFVGKCAGSSRVDTFILGDLEFFLSKYFPSV